MNIVETLESGIQFEFKTSRIYQKILSSQKDQSDAQGFWKEIVGQKEKQIHLLKKAVHGIQNQGPNSSRINLIPSKEMEEGLAWVNRTEKEFNVTHEGAATIANMIHEIISFELQSIYSPLLKVFDLLFIKREPQQISLLTRHLQLLNGYLKKHRAPSLTPLMKKYPFLTETGDGKKGFSEDELYHLLLKQKKTITLRLKNGAFFSGKLDSFDHFSIKCLPLDAAVNPVSTLFLKTAILSIQIHG